ncbi:MAG: hypothetical protein GX270_13975 [Clostridiaceae bacterium]|nr:hypothetical protein [Clostridiaceae bacterium]
MVTIGIPNGLFYYEYSSMWKEFFEKLGLHVLISQDTNKRTMDTGVKYCNNETCLPVKIFHGHVASLKDKADYIFIPRYHSTSKDEYTCPQICGLPDMTAANLGCKHKILEAKINMDVHPEETKESLIEMAKTLKIRPSKVIEAFYEVYDKYLQSKTEENITDLKRVDVNKGKLLLLGHPYMIYDNYLSMRLIEKLKKRNIEVFTPKDFTHEIKRKNAYPFQGKKFWNIGFELLGSAFTSVKDKKVKGIIYLSPFACGLDAFIMEFIELRIKAKCRNVPMLKLTVDEHTGEGGFDTRLEAFIDMIGV